MSETILRLAAAAMGIAFPAPARRARHADPPDEDASRYALSAGQHEPADPGTRRAAAPVSSDLLDEAATLNP